LTPLTPRPYHARPFAPQPGASGAHSMRLRAIRDLAVLLPALALLAAPPARADEEEAPPKDFEAYQEAFETTCIGPADGKQAAETAYDLGGFHYTVNGGRAKISRTAPRKVPGEIRIGVVSSVKDDEKETRANVDEYLARFKAADVDVILSGGDTALSESEIEAVLSRLATLEVPVLAVIGNAENRSAFNRATLAAHRAHRNVLNADLVRVVAGEGWSVVSLPGYYDKRYTHQSGYCMYQPSDVKALAGLAASVDGPVVLLTHGPPRQTGKLAVDFVPEAGNVGDPDLADAIAAAKIPFGIFGHILEAGGRATDLSGKKEVKAATLVDALYLNPGSANSLPWRMNTGPESYGMASVVTLVGKKAKYEIIRSPQRVGLGGE
jgi:Icc-related predicted phosphoesterase